jgi:DNA-binding response OmpR family regulator
MDRSPGAPGARRVLIVAVNDNFHRTLARLLARRGYSVEVAASAEAALEAAGRGGFDAILSEVELPRICGLTLLCRLRERGDRTPVILFTAQCTERFSWLLTGVQPAEALSLPVDPAALAAVLERQRAA